MLGEIVEQLDRGLIDVAVAYLQNLPAHIDSTVLLRDPFVVVARKGTAEGRKTAIPFGPFLAFGALVAVFVGQDIVQFYVNNFLH